MDLSNNENIPIQTLSENLHDNLFYMMRDDLYPISFGGNKTRKAMLFFEDLEQKKSDCVITYGSSSSNHCRIIANIAASKGIPCHIVSPKESNSPTANSKMMKIFGASITECSVSEVSTTIEQKMYDLRKKGFKPYFIQVGGHGNLGTHDYVKAYEEILKYEKEKNIYFDYIFHTSGTGTTQAGLVCGKLLHGDNRNIVGISNARKNPHGGNVVRESVKSYLKDYNIPINDVDINFIDNYVLEGYGSYNDKILKTIKKVLINDGIPMDVTYTGKAFWGMKEFINNNDISDKNILFIHTGGTPLFFDRLEELTDE